MAAVAVVSLQTLVRVLRDTHLSQAIHKPLLRQHARDTRVAAASTPPLSNHHRQPAAELHGLPALISHLATAGTTRDAYTPDGPVAKRIAERDAYFPFGGIPKFYDIGGFLKDPRSLSVGRRSWSTLQERGYHEHLRVGRARVCPGTVVALALNCVEINQSARCRDDSSLSHFSGDRSSRAGSVER